MKSVTTPESGTVAAETAEMEEEQTVVKEGVDVLMIILLAEADTPQVVFQYLPSIKDLGAVAYVKKALWKPTAER